jgi:linoleoyl-CoA desaturase
VDAKFELKFDPDKTFENELRRRVTEYFRTTGRSSRDNPVMYLKTVIILAFFASSYVLLVFFAHKMWQAIPLALLLGFAIVG